MRIKTLIIVPEIYAVLESLCIKKFPKLVNCAAQDYPYFYVDLKESSFGACAASCRRSEVCKTVSLDEMIRLIKAYSPFVNRSIFIRGNKRIGSVSRNKVLLNKLVYSYCDFRAMVKSVGKL